MLEFFKKLLDTSDFPARWYCGNWSEGLGWLHILSDVATFAAYVAIPLTLAWMIRQRGKDIVFPKAAWLFVAFIFACGSVHLVEAIIFWHPIYRVSGVLKFITAVVSCASVIAVVRIAPVAIEMPGVLAVNEELRREIARRTQTEERLTAILDSMSDGVMVSDREGDIELMNPAAKSIFKFSDGDRLYSERFRNYSLFIDDGQTQLTNDDLPLRRVARGTPIDNLEIQIRNPDRNIAKTILLRGRPIRDQQTDATGAVVVFHDITSLKQARKDRDLQMKRLERTTASATRVTRALQNDPDDNETFLRVIADVFNCTTVMLATCDPNGEHADQSVVQLSTYHFSSQSANPEKEVRELAMRDSSDFLCETLLNQAIVMDQLPSFATGIQNLAVGGLSVADEVRGALMVGNRREPFDDDALDLLKRVSLLISAPVFTRQRMEAETRARLLAEQSLVESRKQLDRLSRINSVGELAAGIAHELNQPLTAMINYTDAAKQELEQPTGEIKLADVTSFTNSAHEQALRAKQVLKSIRSMVRLDAVSFDDVRLKDLAHECSQLLSAEIRDCDARLDLSDINESIVLHADRIQLEQLLINLIRNAIQAMANSEIRRVSLSTSVDKGMVTLTVADTGTGFSSDVGDQLFDAFFTTRGSGLGLGLKICRSIVELHGGRIHAANGESVGATFTITIPLTQSTAINPSDC